MLFFVAVTVIGTYYSDQVFDFLSESSESLNYADTMGVDGGASILHLIIAVSYTHLTLPTT